MDLWYQSFTDPIEHAPYFERLESFVNERASSATEVRVEGMQPSAAELHPLTEFRCARVAVRNAIRAEEEGFDGVLIGHFQDAGLEEAKACVDIPVLGLGETSMLYGCMLGQYLGLVTIHPVFVPWHRQQITHYGLNRRMVGVEAIDVQLENFMDAFQSEDSYRELLEGFRSRAAELVEQGAEVIIPAGGLPMLLLSSQGEQSMREAPILNGISVLVTMGEAAVQLREHDGLAVSRAGHFRRPSPRAREQFLESFEWGT